MKKFLKDLINTTKYKRKANKYKNNYQSALEEIDPLKDEIIQLQKDKITLLELNDKYKNELKELKKKEETKNAKKKK